MTTRPLVLSLMVLTGLAYAEDAAHGGAAAAPAGGAAAAGDGLAIHGFLKTRSVSRWTDGASDNDLYETVEVDVGDAEKNRVTAHLLGDVSYDLDGDTDNRGYYVYDSARDSDGSPLCAKVYSAYVDVHRLGVVSLVRIGRQSQYETPEITFFDGGRLESRELGARRVVLGVYGGIPVHLYQPYAMKSLVEGAYAKAHLWKGARVRLDWEHLEDRNVAIEQQNTLLSAAAWQSLGRSLDLHGRYTRLDDRDRDVLGRATWIRADWDLRVQASYYQQLMTRRDAVIEADAYYPVLKDYVPYREVRARASKGIGEHVDLDLGMDWRRLTDSDRESAFNHEFDHYYASVALLDVWRNGSSLSVTGERWQSGGRKTTSEGADATVPLGAKVKVSAGTAYYLYQYDYDADQERDDVHDYYLKVAYQPVRAWRLAATYSFEDDSTGRYNELRCEATWNF